MILNYTQIKITAFFFGITSFLSFGQKQSSVGYYDYTNADKEIIYSDNFDSNGVVTKFYSYGYGKWSYKKFQLTSTENTHYTTFPIHNSADINKNIEFEATFKSEPVVGLDLKNGLIIGANENNWDRFEYFAGLNGILYIKQIDQSGTKLLYSSTLNTFDPTENITLTFRKIENHAYFFLNHKCIFHDDIKPLYGNYFGINTSDNNTIYITQIDLRYIKQSSGKLTSEKNSNSITSALFQPSDLVFNEKPAGVKLVKSEEEWLRLSSSEPCCCYPQFNENYKGFGLLYNYLAYQLIKNQLKISNQGITVCTDADWKNQLMEIKANNSKIEKFKLNYYPGYFDEDWFGPELKMVGYWYNEHSVLNFSEDSYGEAMLDENLYDEENYPRRSLAAFSIRLVKSPAILCGQNNWYNEAAYFRGTNNAILFVSNQSDWDKYTKKGKACCCYLNFKRDNENLGFLYNKSAYQLLINDPTIKNLGYKMASDTDWIKLVTCAKEKNIQSYIFDCEKVDQSQFTVHSNGFYEDHSWFPSNSNVSRYWVADSNSIISVLQLDCISAARRIISVDNSQAYFIQLIKIDQQKN
jgi:hypothetical protein